MIHLLAWRPFIDPIDLHRSWWLLLLPLALGVSLVYKAVRVRRMALYPREVATMTAQIVIWLVVLAAASFVFVEGVVRYLADH